MWYFKTETISHTDDAVVEAAIRLYAAKRHTSLDLQSAATYTSTDKMFLGLENEKRILITRLRSPVERLLPKLIIKFDVAKGFTEYKIRYSLLSFIVALFLVIGAVLKIIYSIGGKVESDLLTVVLACSLFFLLSFLEYHLSKARLRTAISLAATTNKNVEHMR